ncbi:MAG TPA: type II CAAX endopeptidase family protein [Stellaceae bacterium]|nr:type II CAAX endopeptidase family protein [Stellaceae bacterium]
MPPQGYGWRFIDLAALGRNTFRSYALTILRIVLLPLAVAAIVFGGLFAGVAAHWLSSTAAVRMSVVAAFGLVVVAGIALAWGVARSHRRPWLSLISTDLALDSRRLAIGAGIEGGILIALVAAQHVVTGAPWRAPSGLPVWVLAIVAVLIPFQAASEEMLFRGYLTQALGRLVRSRIVIAVIVGLAWGALHLNAYGPLTIPYLLILSLIYSAVSLRDERIELTIGAHSAMNWMAIGATDLLTGHAAVTLTWPALGVLVVHGLVFYAVTRLLVRRFCAR